MTITKVRSAECWTDYRVQIGTLDEIVHAWAIVGGQLAMTLKDDWLFSKRFNYCPERDTGNPEYANWKAWDGVHIWQFDNMDDDFYQYVTKAVGQREVQRERERLVGPGRISPRFHDKGNLCYFTCSWGWRGIPGHGIIPPTQSAYVSPVTAESNYYAGRCSHEIQTYANDDWAEASRRLDEFPGLLKTLHKLDEDEFLEYLEIVEPLRKYKKVK